MVRRVQTSRSDDGEVIQTPIDQWEGAWSGTEPIDMTGRRINPGDWIVKTFQSGRSSSLEIRQVREVRAVKSKAWEGGRQVEASHDRVFLDTSNVPVQFPSRCLIIDWDPKAERLSHTADPQE